MADLSFQLRKDLEKHLEAVEMDLGEAKDYLQTAQATVQERQETVQRLERDRHALQLALGLVDPPVAYPVES
jgi:chromosome segregation ATPase